MKLLFQNTDLIIERLEVTEWQRQAIPYSTLAYITDFCIDQQQRIRTTRGVVATTDEQENDPRFTPRNAYTVLDVEHWEDGSTPTILFELPNPALGFLRYVEIRRRFILEFSRRLSQLNRENRHVIANTHYAMSA